MTKPATPIPSLRDLALDHIATIAAELRQKDRTLTRAQSIAKAATTPEGREAHRLYNSPESHMTWPEAIKALTSRVELEKASGGRARKAAPAPAATSSPANALYGQIVEQALAAAPAGRSEAAAVADFLATAPGQLLWRQYNAALQAEGNS